MVLTREATRHCTDSLMRTVTGRDDTSHGRDKPLPQAISVCELGSHSARIDFIVIVVVVVIINVVLMI